MAKPNTLTNLKIDEVSFCAKGMNQHARVALFKSAEKDKSLTIAKATFQEALQSQLLSSAVCDIFYDAFDNQYSANQAFRTALIDDLVNGGDGTTPSAAYVAAISMMAANAVNAARAIGATATPAQLQSIVEKAVSEFVQSKQQETTMSITTKAALLAAVAKFDPNKDTVATRDEIHKAATDLGCDADLPVSGPLAKAADTSAELAKLRADLAKRDALDTMSAEVRKHYDGLDASAQTAFLAKSKDERDAVVTNINKADPIVYTTADGLEIRKSDGGVVLALAKKSDKDAIEIADLRKSNGAADLAKRAAAFQYVPKATAMLKAIDLMPEADRPEAIAAMTAMNKSNGTLFKVAGSTAAGLDLTGDDAAPFDKMETIVKRIAKERNIPEYQAHIEAAENDAEYQALYAEMTATPAAA